MRKYTSKRENPDTGDTLTETAPKRESPESIALKQAYVDEVSDWKLDRAVADSAYVADYPAIHDILIKNYNRFIDIYENYFDSPSSGDAAADKVNYAKRVNAQIYSFYAELKAHKSELPPEERDAPWRLWKDTYCATCNNYIVAYEGERDPWLDKKAVPLLIKGR